MSNLAIILILISALLHAGWNLISKRSSPSAAFFLAANSIGAWIFFPWVIVVFRQVSILSGAFMGLVFLKEAAHRLKILGLAMLFTGLLFVDMS